MGRAGLSYATIYFVASAVVTYSLGVFIAMQGNHGFRKAASGLLRIPALYALAAAAIILVTHTPVPAAIMRPVGMLSDAAIHFEIHAVNPFVGAGFFHTQKVGVRRPGDKAVRHGVRTPTERSTFAHNAWSAVWTVSTWSGDSTAV